MDLFLVANPAVHESSDKRRLKTRGKRVDIKLLVQRILRLARRFRSRSASLPPNLRQKHRALAASIVASRGVRS